MATYLWCTGAVNSILFYDALVSGRSNSKAYVRTSGASRASRFTNDIDRMKFSEIAVEISRQFARPFSISKIKIHFSFARDGECDFNVTRQRRFVIHNNKLDFLKTTLQNLRSSIIAGKLKASWIQLKLFNI